MASNEKFCLKWNDFEHNVSSAFNDIREEKDFFDVTLVCGGSQIQAHKVIVAACSPFFKSVLRQNPHQHPLLYLKGVLYDDMVSVLNFMYKGEVNIAQEQLNSFLAVAEDLQVKGLTQDGQKSEPVSSKPSSASYKPQIKKPKAAPPVQQSSSQYSAGAGVSGYMDTGDDDDIQEVVSVKTEPTTATAMQQHQIQPEGMLAPIDEGQYDETYDGQYEEYDDSAQLAKGKHFKICISGCTEMIAIVVYNV